MFPVCPVHARMKSRGTAGNGSSQTGVMWSSTGSCDSGMAAFLDDGPVLPFMTKRSWKVSFQSSVGFNFAVSHQIKGLRGVFPLRNVGQTFPY